MSVLAAGLAGAAAWLLFASSTVGRRAVDGQPRLTGPLLLGAVALGALALAGMGAGGGAGVTIVHRFPVVLGCAVLGGAAVLLLRAHRRRQDAVHVADCVRRGCELLAAELAAGLPPEVALRSAVEAWPPLAEAARAERLGLSVPEALRALAERPGAGGLKVVAAAWQLTHRTGGGLSDALATVAQGLRAEEATDRVVRAELASARSTARLVAALPLLTLALGSGTGGSPVGFLLGTTPGLLVAVVGVAWGLVGLWWIERIAGAGRVAGVGA